MHRPDAAVTTLPTGRNRARQVAPVLAGAVLCALGAAMARTSSDAQVFRAVNAWGPLAPAAWSALTVAGLAGVTWIVAAEARAHETRTAARLLWLIVVGGILVHLLKHLIGSARPLAALGDAVVHVTGEALRAGSMPSGHSATAVAFATLLVSEIGWSNRRAALASAAWIAYAVAICLSRIAVGAHWPSDVLVGAGLGLAVGRLALHAWPVPAMARAFATPTGRRLVGVSLLLALVEPFAATQPHHYADARWFAWLLVPLALWGAWQPWRPDMAPAQA